MDLSNIQDPSGIDALLDSLRGSSVFTVVDATASRTVLTSESAPTDENSSQLAHVSSSFTQQAENHSSLSSKVSVLLSQLNPQTTPFPSSTRSTETSTSYDISKYPPLPFHSTPKATLRDMTFQESLPHLGRLLGDDSILHSIKKMKREQDETEKRLMDGRMAILAAQKKKVDDAIAKAKIMQVDPTMREIDTMKAQFDRELDTYDRESILRAWDAMISKQQNLLEQLGIPTFFQTDLVAERTRQRRVFDVISAMISDSLE